jgi:hypothetical protein
LNQTENHDIFINIFANTVGYWVVKQPLVSTLVGTETLKNVMSQLVHSNSFKKAYGEDTCDFSFLITALDFNKMEKMQKMQDTSKENSNTLPNLQDYVGEKLAFDFCFYKHSENRAKYLKQLATLVEVKNKVGHYMWMNMSGIVALVVAMISSIIAK